jgi:leader peptidase (prepilin peptidase)/N-methyltransferase
VVEAPAQRVDVRLAITVVGAAAAAVAATRAGLRFEAVLAVAFVAVLSAVAIVDIEERRVPNVLVLPAAAVALFAQALLHSDLLLECVVAGVGAAAFFFIANLVSHNAVGMGDVKLALLMGVVLGEDVLTALFVGGLAAAAAGLVLLSRRGFSRGHTIAFAPFLALGAVAALLLGTPPLYA